MQASRALRLFSRSAGGRGLATVSTQLVYGERGDPLKVLSQRQQTIDDPKDGEVLVNFLAAPVNPADMNMIQGVYPIQPQLPAVGGNEGVGTVVKAHSSVTSLKEGDTVIPRLAGSGTWQTHAVYKADDLHSVDKRLANEDAAMLLVNPPTAYRMLHDFGKLDSHSLVVQNGATSGVGRAVIQLADRLFGARTLNIIRDRATEAETTATVDELKSLSERPESVHVITESQLREKGVKGVLKEYGGADLALNCVGGKTTLSMSSMLNDRCAIVTYGAMARQPVQIAAGPLIFKDIRSHGFWVSRWYANEANREEAARMIDTITEMIMDERLDMAPCQHVPLDKWQEAVESTLTMQPGKLKQLLVFN